MIICTKTSDVYVKKAFSKDSVSISSLQNIINGITLDPTLSEPTREAYVVTSEDIKSPKAKQQFIASLGEKHPKVRIIFIDKASKASIPIDTPGIDAFLVRPKPGQIAETIGQVIAMDAISDVAQIQENSPITEIPEFKPEDGLGAMAGQAKGMLGGNGLYSENPPMYTPNGEPMYGPNGEPLFGPNGEPLYDNNGNPLYGPNGEPLYGPNGEPLYDENGNPLYNPDGTPIMGGMFSETMPEMELPLPEPTPDIPITPMYEEPTEKASELIARLKGTNTVSDIGVVMREINASTIIKDMMDSNSSYAMIEEKVKGLNEAIHLVLQDNTIRTLEEKLSKVRAYMHDKAFFSSKGNTLLEQRIEEVVDTVCTHTSELLHQRLSEIDTAIVKVKTSKEIETLTPRLAGLNEERINLILELRVLDNEIAQIHKATDDLIVDHVTSIAAKAIDITGNEILNAQIRARGDILVGNATKDAIRAAVSMSTDRVSDDFKMLHYKVVSMIKLLDKLFDVDNEIIAAQQQLIKFLEANKVEDTVIADSLLKKALRLFVAEEGSGRTIVPYLLSYYKSRQNANVLLFDITGTGKYDDYNIPVMTPDNFLLNQNQQEFLVVSGSVSNTVANAQRIVNALMKAADYYRVVNVVLRPDQRELLETIAPDTLCINFITDVTTAHINSTKYLIEELDYDNVARRVIVNKCDIPLKPIVTKLGLDERLDYQICTIPTIPAIVDASITGYNPYGISSVSLLMEDVLKHA